MKLDDETNINVRTVSSSQVGRWAVDIQNAPNLKGIGKNGDNRFEVKFK